MWHADENFDPDDALHTLGFDLRASFSTCAIVGSSGALLHDRRGAEIDAHDLVIRFNNAPVAGYEAVVGSRTDLRLLNSHAIAGILQRCARFSSNGTCAPVPQRHACCPKAKVLLNSGRERIALCYRSACGGANAPGQANVLTALSDHPLILAFKASLPASQSLLSGVHAIAVAQLVCKRRISLYGFTSEPRWRASADGVAVQPSYHYYDDCTLRVLRIPRPGRASLPHRQCGRRVVAILCMRFRVQLPPRVATRRNRMVSIIAIAGAPSIVDGVAVYERVRASGGRRCLHLA